MRKRNIVVYVLMSACLAVFVAIAAAGFALGEVAAGVVGVIFCCVCAAMIGATYAQGRVNARCEEMFRDRRYDEERAYLEKTMRSPLFACVRIVALQHYIAVCLALDDLPTAKRYIERLRHGGGAGWKYRTAYGYILILLDGGEVEAARGEYEDFRTQCADAEIYRNQIDVLRAIFHRLYNTNDAEPLPETAVGSRFPVVGRILGRAIEERVKASSDRWGE